MMIRFLSLFFIFYLFFVKAQVILYNTDTKTITQDGIGAGVLVTQTVELGLIQKAAEETSNSYKDYYSKLYEQEKNKELIRKQIKSNDNKLKMAAKYFLMSVLIGFIHITSKPLSNQLQPFGFITDLKMNQMLQSLLPSLLSRAIFMKTYNDKNLTSVDLIYLIAGQYDVLKSSTHFVAKIDKVLYFILILSIIKYFDKKSNSSYGTIMDLKEEYFDPAGIGTPNINNTEEE